MTEARVLDAEGSAAPLVDNKPDRWKMHRAKPTGRRHRGKHLSYCDAPVGYDAPSEWDAGGAAVLSVSKVAYVPIDTHIGCPLNSRQYMVQWGPVTMPYAQMQAYASSHPHNDRWECPSHPPPATPPQEAACVVTWDDCLQHCKFIKTLPGGAAAISAFHRARHTDPRDDQESVYRAKRARATAERQARLVPPARSPPPPSPYRLVGHTVISTTSINPCRDAHPTGSLQAYRVPGRLPSSPTLIRLCDWDGRAVGLLDITAERFAFLELQYQLHATPTDPPFLDCLKDLLLRYHPKSKLLNPQGNALKLQNHWSLPSSVMQVLRECCGVTTELFASPLNCSLAPGGVYCSAYPEDCIFGATHNSMLYHWAGSNQANPEYEPADMLEAFRRAIDSACASTLPFSCILVLPDWSESPYRHPDILSHPSVRLLTSVPAHKFKFVPPDQDNVDASAHTQADVATWGVDFFLVANPEGLATFIAPNLTKLQLELVAALRQVSHYKDLHVSILPAMESLPPCTLDLPFAPSSSPPRPLPSVRSTARPVQFSSTWLRNPSITHIPSYRLVVGTPLSVVEMCAGIGTGMESLLAAGHSVASYAWADINPAAWAATRHRLSLLHSRYPAQFPPSASVGWDTRIPFDICCITPAMLSTCFPTGIDIIIAGPPCQPYSSASLKKGF